MFKASRYPIPKKTWSMRESWFEGHLWSFDAPQQHLYNAPARSADNSFLHGNVGTGMDLPTRTVWMTYGCLRQGTDFRTDMGARGQTTCLRRCMCVMNSLALWMQRAVGPRRCNLWNWCEVIRYVAAPVWRQFQFSVVLCFLPCPGHNLSNVKLLCWW